MTTKNISKGIIGTMRKLANRWADSELLVLATSLVAIKTARIIKITPIINLSTYLYSVYTKIRYFVDST